MHLSTLERIDFCTSRTAFEAPTSNGKLRFEVEGCPRNGVNVGRENGRIEKCGTGFFAGALRSSSNDGCFAEKQESILV